uniref:Uncharacterized protein n=1 Tax=Cyprinus carpio TaxID=7962 RepID=A0A8C1QSS2_CYPCA
MGSSDSYCRTTIYSHDEEALYVKQIMEEAVTRKFVHEDSSHIVSLCGKSLNIQKLN